MSFSLNLLLSKSKDFIIQIMTLHIVCISFHCLIKGYHFMAFLASMAARKSQATRMICNLFHITAYYIHAPWSRSKCLRTAVSSSSPLCFSEVQHILPAKWYTEWSQTCRPMKPPSSRNPVLQNRIASRVEREESDKRPKSSDSAVQSHISLSCQRWLWASALCWLFLCLQKGFK